MGITNPRQLAESAERTWPTDGRALHLLQQFATESRIPGMSIAIAGPDREHFAGAVGYADLATRRRATIDDEYPWFSMTKIATATAAMRLHADGRLDLDAPIGAYLPGYRPHAAHGHPTTRHLLNHTAGLANPLPVRWVRPEGQSEDPAHRRRIIARHGTPRRAVGTEARYSNIGYLLAGDVIEAVSGQRVEDCVTETVLRPLRMDATGYSYSSGRPRATGYVRMPAALVPVLRGLLPDGIVGARYGAYTSLNPFLVNGASFGGLIGTVTDAARFAATHAAAVWDAHPLLDHEDLELMRTISAPGRPFHHGIGWFCKPADRFRTPGFVEHYGTGGGFWNAMRVYPHDRVAIVAMANTTASWDVDRLFTQLKELSWT
jgi:CubicO group peptidase (beta-lactamase class C family)